MEAQSAPREGHPIEFATIQASELDSAGDTIEAIYDHRLCGIIVRDDFPLGAA